MQLDTQGNIVQMLYRCSVSFVLNYQKHLPKVIFEFSRNYTKLAMLSFLYCFVVKGKLI